MIANLQRIQREISEVSIGNKLQLSTFQSLEPPISSSEEKKHWIHLVDFSDSLKQEDLENRVEILQ